MVCTGATGATCTGANGEDGHDVWAEISPGPDTVLSVVNGLTYTITWTPTMAGTNIRVMYRDATSGQMNEDLVDGTLGTWQSPIVDLLNRQINITRFERPLNEQQSIWTHLEVVPLPNAVTHNGVLVTHNGEAVTHG